MSWRPATATGILAIATATVMVPDGPVTVGPMATLTANPPVIKAGESSLLSWTTTDATGAALTQNVGTDIGELTEMQLVMGSETVTPGATTVYTITARDDDAATDDFPATATVTVLPNDNADGQSEAHRRRRIVPAELDHGQLPTAPRSPKYVGTDIGVVTVGSGMPNRHARGRPQTIR